MLCLEACRFTLDGYTDNGPSDSPVVPKVEQVRSMLAPFILRRLKSAVLDQLVAKTTVVNTIPLVRR
jgi:SNF2 family DNA or RNA helicase